MLAAQHNVPQQRSVWITPDYLKRNKVRGEAEVMLSVMSGAEINVSSSKTSVSHSRKS